MDDEKYLVAAASSDGIVVNNHFGKAGLFYIYEVDDEGNTKCIENRRLTPVCEGGNHDENRLKENLEKLKDCKYILVSRIGNGAAMMAEKFGITPMELPGIIAESIEELIKYRKIQNLFSAYDST